MHFTWCSHGQGTVHVQWDRFALASAALATQASEGGASGVIRSGRVRLRRSGPRLPAPPPGCRPTHGPWPQGRKHSAGAPCTQGWGIRHPSHPVYAHPEQRASLWTLLEARLGKSSGEGRAPAAAALAAVMAVHHTHKHTHRTHTPCGTRPRRPVGPSPAPSSTGPKVTPVISRSTMISCQALIKYAI